ncbi:hypothetical protein AAT19DRAFT_9338 [Rhodotorula toruloides]|uniref:Uncharacterized protein n=1 Tax=Rhodotorula toruloides TaxID=5286 RepID=A0A2T0A1W9_RHOTO|nr:hypothetical protein AAT19DRAFT_9338 [Rhodotorula toruloides]
MSLQGGDVSDYLSLGYPSNRNTLGPHCRGMSFARSEAFSDLAGPHSPAFSSAAPPWSGLGFSAHRRLHHACSHVIHPALSQLGTSFVSSASVLLTSSLFGCSRASRPSYAFVYTFGTFWHQCSKRNSDRPRRIHLPTRNVGHRPHPASFLLARPPSAAYPRL